MKRIEVNVATGEVAEIQLSQQEIDQAQSFISPIIIREIDARRLRLALSQLGKLSIVKTAIASLNEAAQIDWEYATIIKEDYPLVLALGTNLNLDINAIFTLASSLP